MWATQFQTDINLCDIILAYAGHLQFLYTEELQVLSLKKGTRVSVIDTTGNEHEIIQGFYINSSDESLLIGNDDVTYEDDSIEFSYEEDFTNVPQVSPLHSQSPHAHVQQVSQTPPCSLSPLHSQLPHADVQQVSQTPSHNLSPLHSQSPHAHVQQVSQTPPHSLSPLCSQSPHAHVQQVSQTPPCSLSPLCSKSPQAWGTSQSDMSQGTPVSPNCSKSPQARGTPQSDMSPGTPVSPNCSKSPQAWGTSQSDMSPGTPVSPNHSKSPQAWGTPQSDVQQVAPYSPNGDNGSLPPLSPHSEVTPSSPSGDNKSLPPLLPHSEVAPSSPNGDNKSLPPLSPHSKIEEVPLGSPSSPSAYQISPKKDGALDKNNIVKKLCPSEPQDLAEAVGASNNDKILDISEETIVYSCPEDEKINKPKRKKKLKQKLSRKSGGASGKHTKVKKVKLTCFFVKMFSTQIKKGINTFSSVTQDTNLSVKNVERTLRQTMVITNVRGDTRRNIFIVTSVTSLFHSNQT